MKDHSANVPLDDCGSTENFSDIKLKREIEKLEIELNEAKIPFYRSAKFLIPILSAIVMAGIAVMQTVAVKRLSSPEGAVEVLQAQLGRYGFNASSLWAIWHVLDERQRLGDKKSRVLLVGIQSIDDLVTENLPEQSPIYNIITLSGKTTNYQLSSKDWRTELSKGQNYQFRSEALRYLLHIRSSIDSLNAVLSKKIYPITRPDGGEVNSEYMLILSSHRDELHKKYKEFSRIVGKNPRFIEAGNYVVENLLDTQLD